MKPAALLPLAACLCLGLGACNGEQDSADEVTGAVPEAWRIPERFQGEWHEKIENCADVADPTRMVLTADTLVIDDAVGTVMAVSTSPNSPDGMTVVAEMTTPQARWQRAYVFDLSEEDQVITGVEEGPGMPRRRCPVAAQP